MGGHASAGSYIRYLVPDDGDGGRRVAWEWNPVEVDVRGWRFGEGFVVRYWTRECDGWFFAGSDS